MKIIIISGLVLMTLTSLTLLNGPVCAPSRPPPPPPKPPNPCQNHFYKLSRFYVNNRENRILNDTMAWNIRDCLKACKVIYVIRMNADKSMIPILCNVNYPFSKVTASKKLVVFINSKYNHQCPFVNM